MGLLEETLRGKSLADYTNTQLRLALGAVLYTNTADMWKKYLNQIGYTGDVSQMLQKYYVDYSVPSNFRNYINAGASIFNPQNMFAADAGLQGYVYDLNDSFAEKTAYRRNQITWSEQFDNAVWAKSAVTISANAGVAPDSTTTADKFIPTVTVAAHSISQTVLSTAGTFSIYAKADGETSFSLWLVGASIGVVFNLTAQTASPTSGSISGTIQSVGSGWFRCTATSASATTTAHIYGRNGGGFSGDGTSGILIWGAQLEVGSTATAYRPVTDWNTELLAAFPNTMVFTDSALTAPAAINGLVGGIKDMSGRGNNATQSTTGNKPVLRGTPVGGNMVTNGDFASDTWWTKGTDWVISGGVASRPISASFSNLSRSGLLTIGNVYRVELDIVAISGTVNILCGNALGASLQSFTTTGRKVAYLPCAGDTTLYIQAGSAATTCTIDNVAVHDVSAGQVQAPYALQFDGVDDFLQTASVNFTATDKMTVCHGVRKLSDSAQGIISELTASLAANNGSFYLSAPNSAAANFAFASKGTVSATDIEAGFAAPYLAVITGIGNISGDSAQLRTNVVAGTAVTTDQGTGNYANAVLYLGRRGGTTLPYNGLMFSAICVGKATSATELANIERWTNQRTGAY